MGKGRPVQFQRKDQRALGGNAFLDRQLVRSYLCDQLNVEQRVRDQARRLQVIGQASGAAPISLEWGGERLHSCPDVPVGFSSSLVGSEGL